MTLTQKVPLKRKTAIKKVRAQPRRVPELTCAIRTCNHPPRVFGWCAKHARKEADRLFSLYIRKRDGKCQALCQLPYDLQCAHLISRRYMAVRWMPENAVALCTFHHKKWTEDPLGWDVWCLERLGGAAWDGLKLKARRGGMPDLGQTIIELRLLLEGMEGA